MASTINAYQSQQLRAALEAHATKPARILLMGPTGCGKSTVVRTVASELGFDLVELNGTTSLKQIEEELRSTQLTRTIESFFTTTKKLLLIDDFDILAASFPKLIASIITWLTPNAKTPPVVFTIQAQEERRMTDLKKHVQVIRLARPTTQACLQYFMQQTENGDDARLLELIKAHKHDLRAISMNLNQITPLPVPSAIDTLRSTFSDLTLFDIQNKVFATSLSEEHLEELAYTDSKLLALLLYENVPIELQKNRGIKGVSTQMMLRHLHQISDAYVDSDAMEHFTNVNVCWELTPIFNTILLGAVNGVIHMWPRVECPNATFEFTPMMTKTSLRYQYAKRKRSFLHTHGLSGDHFIDAVQIAADFMGSTAPKDFRKDPPFELDKETIDTSVKWGLDYDRVDAKRATAWKKLGNIGARGEA